RNLDRRQTDLVLLRIEIAERLEVRIDGPQIVGNRRQRRQPQHFLVGGAACPVACDQQYSDAACADVEVLGEQTVLDLWPTSEIDYAHGNRLETLRLHVFLEQPCLAGDVERQIAEPILHADPQFLHLCAS